MKIEKIENEKEILSVEIVDNKVIITIKELGRIISGTGMLPLDKIYTISHEFENNT
jgi:hypothetical protein